MGKEKRITQCDILLDWRSLPLPAGSTPPWRIRLKARVDLGDQTAEFIPLGVISTVILTYFNLVLGTNLRILISVINTRFQLDALGWCISG